MFGDARLRIRSEGPGDRIGVIHCKARGLAGAYEKELIDFLIRISLITEVYFRC